MTKKVDCPQCNGLGASRWAEHIPCSRCGGSGEVEAWTLSEEEAEEEATRNAVEGKK